MGFFFSPFFEEGSSPLFSGSAREAGFVAGNLGLPGP